MLMLQDNDALEVIQDPEVEQIGLSGYAAAKTRC
jgi:hypothetical protein